MTQPRISVCMPYWQRQRELDRSLAAYRALYRHLDLQVSICDDGSPNPVQAPGCLVTRLPTKEIGLNPCVPMNRAVAASSGDVVVLTNPEIEHTEDVLSGMLPMLEHADDYVTVACRDAGGLWLAGPQVDYTRNGRLPVPAVAHFQFCAMLPRALWDRVGGFDEDYRHGRICEDYDWLWTLADAGARFKTAPGLVRHHATPHAYQGVHATNRDRLMKKWGHKWTA